MSNESAVEAIRALVAEDIRFKTSSKGLARSLVWRNGVPPPEMGRNFGRSLTEYLQTQADRGVIASLRLVRSDRAELISLGKIGFHRAAESYESILRNGDENDPRRPLNRVLAAASYHLAGYAASAFSLLKGIPASQNNDPTLRITSLLMLRDMSAVDGLIREISTAFYGSPKSTAEPVRARDWDEKAVEQHFAHSIALFTFAMRLNDDWAMAQCAHRLSIGEKFCLQSGDVWTRLLFAVCIPITQELWERRILSSIPPQAPEGVDQRTWSEKRNLFSRVLVCRKISEFEIWPSQMEPARQIFEGESSFAAALPTSAGKTRIAELATFKTLLSGKRVVYVTPLRALSAQVERSLRRIFGPLGYSVSALYGAQGISAVDEATFDENDIVVATPEKAGFALRNAPELFDKVGLTVFDEAHMVSSESRGVAYEALILTLKRRDDRAGRRMLALSALLPEVETSTAAFSKWLSDGAYEKPIGSPVIQGQSWRPTRQCFGKIHRGPLSDPANFRYEISVGGETSWVDNFIVQQVHPPPPRKRKKVVFPSDRNDLALAAAEKLLSSQKSVLIYCPRVDTVDSVCEQYLAALNNGFIKPFPVDEKGAADIDRAIRIAEETLPHGSQIVAALQKGLAVHHAQLPRPFLREIDRLISLSVVRAVVASPTVNAGLNIAATCVLFNGCDRGEMERYRNPAGSYFFKNGEFIKSLKVLEGSESMNVAGRAGRAFVDTHGEVLGVCFDSNQEKRWNQLRERMAKRSFTSGLAEVLRRLVELLEGKSNSGPAIREFIANNVDAIWTAPGVEMNELRRWNAAVQTLDQALLAFVDNLEVDAAGLAQVLDEALASSFFREAIRGNLDEATYLLMVGSRSRVLWAGSTSEQRKGWYFAGLGLSDGLLLDTKATIVGPLLRNIETAIELLGGSSYLIPWLVEVARHLFEIPTFHPKDGLPSGWERILRLWLEGNSLQFIFADSETTSPSDDAYRAAAHFIEDGIVYRLTWGIEAVRVRRPDLVGGDEETSHRGLRCAAFLEAGTLHPTVAFFQQIGLSSRRIAQEVVTHENLNFTSASGVRGWLRSNREQPSERWGYIEETIRPLWLIFLKELGTTETDEWKTRVVDLRLDDLKTQRPKSEPVVGLLRRDPENATEAVMQTADGAELGRARWPFGELGPDYAAAWLLPDGVVRLAYTGP